VSLVVDEGDKIYRDSACSLPIPKHERARNRPAEHKRARFTNRYFNPSRAYSATRFDTPGMVS